MDKSAEGGLKSIGNTTTVRRKPPENREQLQKFPLNLKFLYATGPWPYLPIEESGGGALYIGNVTRPIP